MRGTLTYLDFIWNQISSPWCRVGCLCAVADDIMMCGVRRQVPVHLTWDPAQDSEDVPLDNRGSRGVDDASTRQKHFEDRTHQMH